MPKNDSPVSEYLRIRRYVLTLCQKANGQALLLPSIKELAEQFHVSTPTVSRAMKELTEERYVIGKRGIGSFVNPENVPRYLRNLPTIGILIGDGRMLHYNSYHSRLLASQMVAFSDLPALVHLVFLNSVHPDIVYREIINEKLDVLVWDGCGETRLPIAERLSENGLRVILSEDLSDTYLPKVFVNYDSVGYECGKRLIREGRRNVVFLAASRWGGTLPQLSRAYEEEGLKLNSNLFLPNVDTCLDELDKLFSLNVPIDAVYCPILGGEAWNRMKEKRIDPEAVRVVANDLDLVNIPDFRGIHYMIPFEELSRRLAGHIRDVLNGKNLNGIIDAVDIKIKG